MTDLTLCAPWVAVEDLESVVGCTPCAKITDTTPDEVIAAAVADASHWLWMMTGRRYGGICSLGESDAVTPCIDRCDCDISHHAGPYAGQYAGPCGCGTATPCCGPIGVTLGVSPVVSVDQVQLDGEVFTDWVLVGDVLARTDGLRWPACQDLTAPTFVVGLTWGVAPPGLGVRAAADLACVLIGDACGDTDCAEPANVVRKTGGGMTVEIASPVTDIARSLPRSVRLFLESESPVVAAGAPRMRRPKVGHTIRSRIG